MTTPADSVPQLPAKDPATQGDGASGAESSPSDSGAALSMEEAAGYSLPGRAMGAYFEASESEFSGPTVFGPGGVAVSFSVNADQARHSDRFVTSPIPDRLVREAKEAYAPTGSDEELREALAAQSVVYLTGRADSGMPTTAMVALMDRHGEYDKVACVQIVDQSLGQVLNEPGLLLDGFGHLLEPGDAKLEPRHLEMLEYRAHRIGATVIVVSRADDGEDDFGRYRVRHARPAYDEVFDKWLRYELRRAGQCVDACGDCDGSCHAVYAGRCLDDPGVASQLRDAGRVTDVVRLAKHCAREGPSDLPEDPAGLLRRAGQALDVDQDAVGGKRTSQHVQAFRIAYALLQNVSVTHVFAAVGGLVDELDRAQERRPRGRPVLERSVDWLLGKDLQDQDGRQVEGSGTARCARLPNPRLAEAILNVAWHDYDSLRQPLLSWIRDLGYDGHAAIRWCVAAATGRLCGYDFECINEQVVDVWTRRRDARHRDARQTAAFALEAAARNEHLAPKVLRYVRELVYDPSPYRRQVAIRVYATSFGRRVHWYALDDLGTLARHHAYERDDVVAAAVARLYAPTTARDVLATVCGWAASELPELRAHADRCLVLLAMHSDHAREGLRRLLLDAGLPHEQLAGLWRSALLRPWTAADAWYALEYWLHCADGQPEVADALTDLLSKVVAGSSLRRRFTFYIPQWRGRMPANRILDRLDTLARSSRGG